MAGNSAHGGNAKSTNLTIHKDISPPSNSLNLISNGEAQHCGPDTVKGNSPKSYPHTNDEPESTATIVSEEHPSSQMQSLTNGVLVPVPELALIDYTSTALEGQSSNPYNLLVRDQETMASIRQDIAKSAEIDNIRFFKKDPPWVVTRSMTRVGSEGNLTSSKLTWIL